MEGRALIVTISIALAACAVDAAPSAAPLPPCAPTIGVPTGAPPAVWGFADLHAHPGIERAFGGALVWGEMLQPGLPVSGAEIPVPPPCPVETHAREVSSPLETTLHDQVLTSLGQQPGAYFAHGPIGHDARAPGAPALDAWPNGRDVLHQAMSVNAIRRAYEGGLRVLFASTTDSQVLAQLLDGPEFPPILVPSRTNDLDSATRQLELIHEVAQRQSGWMRVARSPSHARAIIEAGMLAIVPSLEMDGLTSTQVLDLRERFSVAHLVPIHLVDNDLGGTAAFSDIFNTSTALQSDLYLGAPFQFIRVEQTTSTQTRLGWPLLTETMSGLPLLFEPNPVPYEWFARLGYQSTCLCGAAPETAAAFPLMGHRNARGLTDTGVAELQRLMRAGMILDVSHMSWHATERALDVAEAFGGGYPMVASHGGVGAPGQPLGSERDLDSTFATRIGALGGMLGLGTGGVMSELPILTMRGGPVVTLCDGDGCAPGADRACFALDGTECSTSPVAVDPRDEPLTELTITIGSAPSGAAAQPFVEVQLASPLGGAAPPYVLDTVLTCGSASCQGTFDLTSIRPAAQADPLACGGGATPLPPLRTTALQRVTLGLREASSCAGAPSTSWPIAEVEIASAGSPWITLAASSPVTTLGPARGSIDVFVTSEPPPPGRRLLVLSAVAGAGTNVSGASPFRYGTDVCVRAIHRACPTCECERGAVPSPGPSCDGEWRSLSERSSWPVGLRYEEVIRLTPSQASETVCGVELAMARADAGTTTLALDFVQLSAGEDPVAAWAEDYLRVLDSFLGSRDGAIGLGTDINGLAPQFPAAYDDPPRPSRVFAHGCGSEPLDALRAGARQISFADRGLASYGMVADLVALLDTSPEIDPLVRRRVVDSLFQSAEAALRMWERGCEVAAADAGGARPRGCEVLSAP